VSSVGALSAPRGSVVAPTKYSYGRTRIDLTPKKEEGGKRRLLAAEGEKEAAKADASAASAASASEAPADAQEREKITISDDPLDLSKDFPLDYRNWAAVLSQVLLTKEGNSPERARESLKRLMLTAHGHLAKVAAGEELIPRFHLQDPVLQATGVAKDSLLPAKLPPPPFGVTPPKTSATGFSSSATFLNYSPCILSESHTGFSGSFTLLNIIPSLFSFSATHLEADVAPINIQPQLIYLVNKVNQVEPQGFNGESCHVVQLLEEQFFLTGRGAGIGQGRGR